MSINKTIATAAVFFSLTATAAAGVTGKDEKGKMTDAEFIQEYSSQLVAAAYAEQRCTHMAIKVNQSYFYGFNVESVYTQPIRDKLYPIFMTPVREKLDRQLFNLGVEKYCDSYYSMVKKHYVNTWGQTPVTVLEH